jgi:hypothetical protein
MIKSDSKVAPIVAKLESIRKHVPTPGGTPSAQKINVLIPAEWQEIRTARLAVLKAHPDFNTKAARLAAKLRAFQEKLTTAMVKADPTVAPIMAKFGGGHLSPQSAIPPAKTE